MQQIVIISLMTSIVGGIVWERMSGIKHMQMISGLNRPAYWMAKGQFYRGSDTGGGHCYDQYFSVLLRQFEVLDLLDRLHDVSYRGDPTDLCDFVLVPDLSAPV